MNNCFRYGKTARRFAKKLHIQKDLPLVLLFEHGDVLTSVLKQALKSVADPFSISKETGTPLPSRNVFLNRILACFNDHLQL